MRNGEFCLHEAGAWREVYTMRNEAGRWISWANKSIQKSPNVYQVNLSGILMQPIWQSRIKKQWQRWRFMETVKWVYLSELQRQKMHCGLVTNQNPLPLSETLNLFLSAFGRIFVLV